MSGRKKLSAAVRHEYYLRHREQNLEKARARYRAKRTEILAANKEWAQANPERANLYSQNWKDRNPDRVRQRHKGTYAQLREEVMAAYGGRCACCGEAEDQFLTIDHIDGHPKGVGAPRSGNGLYLMLRREGFPEGYQVLCWNCNCAKGFYGMCPHKRAKLESAA